ncbi:helix-turn-helix domain-containing protein [Roseiconus nitratireducens]|uniref:Helix-turn-helix domain-containing protein n=1 Tax=Roseiconus nitratireducens TaxID=2605748 RepID=A0A5M6DIR1_9BACT|nr:helix-turn-helix domain-containing protein [Roseiconus nitratireducens]KAA5546079.1 helix-turn-helix domain-containing protein [Roseiconus nitratireducens]
MADNTIPIAVILPAGQEFASRLMTGVNHYRDERPELDPLELHYRNADDNPLVRERVDVAGAILWVDRNSAWPPTIVARGVKAVNCCFDWRGEPGIVSLGIDLDASCDLVLSHVSSIAPRQFAVVGVNFSKRPHSAALCQRLVDRAAEDGWSAKTHEIQGPHPDEQRRRMTEVAAESELLEFLRNLEKPAFLWCENDHVARMLCNAAEHLHLSVPEQLAIMGSGDYRVASHYSPSLSTLPRPAEEMGYAAARLLHEWILEDGAQPPDLEIPPRPILMRQSTVDTTNWEKIRQARLLIETEACNGITVDRICRRVQLSKGTFTKRYATLYGVTPGADISNVKIETAKRLLRESSQSVAEVGSTIGFSEQSKFSKFFKRWTGLTPTQYRRSPT